MVGTWRIFSKPEPFDENVDAEAELQRSQRVEMLLRKDGE